ncbi:aldehyde dehydrogenase family protein [Peribacillus frigoritolerans]
MTPLIACKIAEIFSEAGLPAGFLNVVYWFGQETGK